MLCQLSQAVSCHAGNPALKMNHWLRDSKPDPNDIFCKAFDEAVLVTAQQHPSGAPFSVVQQYRQDEDQQVAATHKVATNAFM